MIPKSGKINLGCGQVKLDGYINIDNNPDMKPDLLCNVIEGFPFFEDGIIEEVRAYDFLEHIPAGKSVIKVMEEIYRVLKPGGKFESSTPDAQYGQAAFQDPTHISFWVQNSWLYYSDRAYSSLYGIKAHFKIQLMERVPSLESNSQLYWNHVIAIKE
jgi:predicted SAM-dependent methyltransferase